MCNTYIYFYRECILWSKIISESQKQQSTEKLFKYVITFINIIKLLQRSFFPKPSLQSIPLMVKIKIMIFLNNFLFQSKTCNFFLNQNNYKPQFNYCTIFCQPQFKRWFWKRKLSGIIAYPRVNGLLKNKIIEIKPNCYEVVLCTFKVFILNCRKTI